MEILEGVEMRPRYHLCTNATPLQAVQCLEGNHFDFGIVGSGDPGTQDSEWIEMYPEVSWRSIDHAGRLHLF